MVRTLLLLIALAGLAACEGEAGATTQASAPVQRASGPAGSRLAGGSRTEAAGDPSRLAPMSGQDPARILFDTTSVDLGEVFQQGEYPLEYPFQVGEGDPAVISVLDPSCGCTDVRLEVGGERWPLGKPIPSGSRGKVAAIFESKAFVNLKTSRIEVRGSAANLPRTLQLRAMVQPIFRLNPSQALFSEVLWHELGGEQSPSVVMEVTGRDPFTVTNWSYVPDGIDVRELPETRPGPNGEGQVRQYVVSLEEDAPLGTLRRAVIGETDLGHNLEFMVHARVLGPVGYFPEHSVYFGAVNQGDTPVRMFRIQTSSEDHPVPQPSLKIAGKEAFDLLLSEATEGREYVYKIQMKDGLGLGRHASTLEIRWPEGSGLEDRDVSVVALVRRRR